MAIGKRDADEVGRCSTAEEETVSGRVLIVPFMACLPMLRTALPLAVGAAPITGLGTDPAIEAGALCQALN